MQPLDSEDGAVEREDWSESLETVFDEHAELRDVIVQMQETTDLGVLTGQLERLHELLGSHFEREEQDQGMVRMMAEASDGHRRAATELLVDHPGILSAVRDLIERIRAEEGVSIATVEREVASILKRLGVHDTLENDLLRDITSMDPAGTTRARQTRSKALEANLRRTAVNVVIPDEQKVLLDVTADFAGVYENTKKLLWEINHRYVGWSQTLEDLHRRAMGDFGHHIGHERAGEAVAVLCDLYAKVAERATPAAARETAVRKLQYYLEKVARDAGERLPLVLPALDRALDRLDEIFRRTPSLAAVTSPRLKRLTEALLAAPVAAGGTVPRSVHVLAVALREVYRQRLDQADPALWWREQTGAGADAPLPAKLAAVSHAHLQECLDRVDSLEASADSLEKRCEILLALPDNAQIDRGTLEAASCVESEANERWQNRLARINWLIRVLSLETLAAMHEQALSEISHLYTDVLQNADRERLEHVVRDTFSSLRRSSLASSQTSLNLISKIGLEVLATGDPEWFEVVVDEILEWDFPTPDFSGFTDEWQVQVNPAHLRAIRTYLSLVEGNPEVARTLIAALVVHLKIGGVFIADTDLFQKDISRLLNTDIGPVYHQVKHLLKIFPVYFNDIGAEGELRDVSSHLDEIRGRKDPLCHFLRKQCHVESNPLLIRFTHEIARFWATGDREPLRPFVPAPLFDGLDLRNEEYAGLHEVFAKLVESDELDALFELDPAVVEARLRGMGEGRAVDRDKAALLFKLRRLIGRKYEIDHDDLLDRLAAERSVPEEQLVALRSALECDDSEAALRILLDVLEHLKSVVTSTEKTEGYEDVYRKRHIAVGIPSMYGRYREEKFEAIGLTFRIESMANALFEKMFAEEKFEFITRKTLLKVAGWLGLARRALRVDGFRGRGLATGTAMLDQALRAEGFRVDQYINILQILSRSVEHLIRIRFLDVYEDLLERIVTHRIESGATPAEPGSDVHEEALKISEAFFRDLIAQSFGLQQLDHLLGRVLRVIVQWRERFDRHTLTLLMTYDAELSFVQIGPEIGPHDGAIYLGNKGHAIKRMAHDGIPVPDGFIVTTEIFRCREAMRLCEELEQEVDAQLRLQVKRLEELSGARFGDPTRPLLLSVRSGSAISMPGILDTFLNVGMTDEIAEGFARKTGRPWAAWDAYRRFVQGWGMGHGIKRESFNTLMREAKKAAGVAKKAGMTPEQMKGLALRYRDFVEQSGVAITDDPYEQLSTCMDLVLASWHSETAQSYRSATRIADEWGTAVVVQIMVYGNLTRHSGTGVVLTCDPRPTRGDVRLRGEMRLHGDFIVQGQGDDVVSGLVETFPISERQRLSEAEPAPISLEKDFPQVYAALNKHARSMVQDQGMFHQEIEFTFEHEAADGLYILQTRDAVVSQTTTVPAFVPSAELEQAKVATGIGVAGGALSGRVAHNAGDIAMLRERHPEDPIVLLRPDTVPDDIPLILHTDGMVTAIGGATSHAALVAQRLGRTCVVGCRQLEVNDATMCSRIAGREIATGEYLSINGSDGSIYLGKHPATTVRRQRLT
jgi:pyruvate,orthophosphate dikinase